MSYLIVADWDGNNKITRYNTKETEQEASALVEHLKTGIPENKRAPNAFYVIDSGHPVEFLSVDPVAETVNFNVAAKQSEVSKHLPVYRKQRENEGIVVSGVTIQTDIGTRTNILGAKELDTSIKWKTPSGFVTLTSAQVSAIATAIGTHIQKCFDAEAAIEGNTYDTIEELEAAFDAAYNQA